MKDLTAGSGYRVEAEMVPDQLATELHAGAKNLTQSDGKLAVLFDDRESANRALDLLRAQQCPIEKFGRVNSTLEDVFIRTVDAK